jgi:hypothetical protein
MKGLLSAFVLVMVMSVSVAAQDSTMPPQSGATQTPTMAQQGDGSMAQPAKSTAMPASAHKTYGSEGYGSRAEVFLTGVGLVGSHANGNAITEQQTDAAGLAVGYRFHLNSSSALEGRYGFSRNSDKYTIGGVVSSIRRTSLRSVAATSIHSQNHSTSDPFWKAAEAWFSLFQGTTTHQRVPRPVERLAALPVGFFLVTLSRQLPPKLSLVLCTAAHPRVLGRRQEACFCMAQVWRYPRLSTCTSGPNSGAWGMKRRTSN